MYQEKSGTGLPIIELFMKYLSWILGCNSRKIRKELSKQEFQKLPRKVIQEKHGIIESWENKPEHISKNLCFP